MGFSERAFSLGAQGDSIHGRLTDADRSAGGVLAELVETAVAVEWDAAGTTLELLLVAGEPTFSVLVTPSTATVSGEWGGRSYRRELRLRPETLREIRAHGWPA